MHSTPSNIHRQRENHSDKHKRTALNVGPQATLQVDAYTVYRRNLLVLNEQEKTIRTLLDN